MDYLFYFKIIIRKYLNSLIITLEIFKVIDPEYLYNSASDLSFDLDLII